MEEEEKEEGENLRKFKEFLEFENLIPGNVKIITDNSEKNQINLDHSERGVVVGSLVL